MTTPKTKLPRVFSKTIRDGMRRRIRAAVVDTFGSVKAMRTTFPKIPTESNGYASARKAAAAITKQLQQQARTDASEATSDLSVSTVLAIATMTGRRVAYLLTGEQPEFEGDTVPRSVLAGEVAEHVAGVITQSATHTIRTRVYVDGSAALAYLASIARDHVALMQRNDNELSVHLIAARHIPESEREGRALAKAATDNLRARLMETERHQPLLGLVIRQDDKSAVSGAAGHWLTPV